MANLKEVISSLVVIIGITLIFLFICKISSETVTANSIIRSDDIEESSSEKSKIIEKPICYEDVCVKFRFVCKDGKLIKKESIEELPKNWPIPEIKDEICKD